MTKSLPTVSSNTWDPLRDPMIRPIDFRHNPNCGTGVEMGFERPLTHGPDVRKILHDMHASAKASGADFALGFDGDGGRWGWWATMTKSFNTALNGYSI